MNVYKELAEVADAKDSVKKMQDDVLDIFHNHKGKAIKLLKELNDIEQELNELDEEITKISSQLT